MEENISNYEESQIFVVEDNIKKIKEEKENNKHKKTNKMFTLYDIKINEPYSMNDDSFIINGVYLNKEKRTWASS